MKNLLLLLVTCLFTSSMFCQVTQINSNKSLLPNAPLPNGKTLLVSDIDSTLWVTDGTLGGTLQLSASITVTDLGALLADKIIFIGRTAATGTELYITDGTVGGTALLSDINPGSNGSNPDVDLALLNGLVYFTAFRPAEGRELWRTNGTGIGTTLVKDIVPGPAGSNGVDSFNLFSNGSYLLLNVNTTASGVELWRSNGTDAGTFLLKDINTGTPSSNATGFYAFNSLVIFQATDVAHGTEYWTTDGTNANTNILKDINPGPAGLNSLFSIPIPFQFKGKLYFIANDGTRGDEIWYTDGTTANTDILKDIQTGAFAFTSIFNAVILGNTFYFTSTDIIAGRFEIWKSDGLPTGTTLFKSFTPADNTTGPVILTPFTINYNTFTLTQTPFQGNKFFFSASSETDGNELWICDGTLPGTFRVKNIGPGAIDGIINSNYAYTTANIYFSANDGVNGEELWKSDGTEGGTTMVANINPGPASSDPQPFFYINNGKFLFNANNGDDLNAIDLYVIDGVLPLPLNLLNFTVNEKTGNAVLEWSTAQEINSRDFVIERSEDGIHFNAIATVNAAGSSTINRQYNYVDAGIANSGRSNIFYRLKQRDRDGLFTFSKIISLRLKGPGVFTIKLLTNPVSDNLSILLNTNNQQVQFSIKDLSGKTLRANQNAIGNGLINMPVAGLKNGVYVLVAETTNERKVLKFVKQ